jgi:S-adenosylmethionine decarboxylase
VKRELGLHVTMTLKNCNTNILMDGSKLYDLLCNFPPRIGMTLIPLESNPMIYFCHNDEKNDKNIGFSGSCMLWESHFTFHTWSEYNEVDLDVFSCYPFNTDDTIKFLADFFQGIPVGVSIIERGNNEQIYKFYQ